MRIASLEDTAIALLDASAFRLYGKNKIIHVINVHRILESTAKGILKSRAEHNRCTGEIKISHQCRDELLDQLTKETKKAQNEKVNDIIMARNFNQGINGDQMRRFIRENGLLEVHKTLNETDKMDKDNTQESGVKQIDAVLATEEVIVAIQRSNVVDFKEVINTDHRGFIFDLDAQDYFSISTSNYDRNNNIILDPTRRSYCNKFRKKLEEHIE